MRFGVLPDFGKTCRLRAHLWASKLTDFLDICNTIFFSSLSSSRAIRFSCLFATGIARHYTLFNLARLSAFSIFFSDTKRWQHFSSFSTFYLSSSHMRLILIFRASKPYSASPHVLLLWYDSIPRSPSQKVPLCLFVFISFVSRYLPAFWHRRDGILIGMGWYQNLEPRPQGQ